MSDQQKTYVVTKNGIKVSGPLPLDEANAQASQLRSLTESQGEKATISVVPTLMG
jgi:hypothetical protein